MAVSAGVVLAGGRSARMGQDKAALPWATGSLLGQVCTVVAEAVDGPLLVVRARGQALPDLPRTAEVHEDPVDGLGPVQGVAAGLQAVGVRAAVAVVAATDLPFLQACVLRRTVAVLARAPGRDAVVPVVDGRPQLLAAAYRTAAAPAFEDALGRGERRLGAVVASLSVLYLSAADLLADPAVASADPALMSFTNLNDPEEYARARGAHTG